MKFNLKKTKIPNFRIIQNSIQSLSRFGLLCCIILFSFSVQTVYLNINGGNPIDGNQSSVNSISASGTMGGFTNGNYYYTLSRSGDFTTTNLVFSVSGVAWGPNINKFFTTGPPMPVTLSGIIPAGTLCNKKEIIIMKVYNSLGQVVLSKTLTIRNPNTGILASTFKIFGSYASHPTVIKGCTNTSKNILANNIKLYYNGSGAVKKYYLEIYQANAAGGKVAGGFNFTQNWQNGSVPSILTLNTSLVGVSTGSAPSIWTYFIITLYTSTGPCAIDLGGHSALILLNPNPCMK